MSIFFFIIDILGNNPLHNPQQFGKTALVLVYYMFFFRKSMQTSVLQRPSLGTDTISFPCAILTVCMYHKEPSRVLCISAPLSKAICTSTLSSSVYMKTSIVFCKIFLSNTLVVAIHLCICPFHHIWAKPLCSPKCHHESDPQTFSTQYMKTLLHLIYYFNLFFIV